MAVGAIGGSANAYALQAVRSAAGLGQLSLEQQAEVQRLKAIDQKVRAHEAAHQAAGAGLTSGASYQYTRGPDGKQYAVAGEVKIDVSPGQTPSQTLDKARRIQAAALAPADPSAQDRAVAAQAAQMAMQAQQEMHRVQQDDGSGQVNPAIAAYTNQEPAPAPVLSLFA